LRIVGPSIGGAKVIEGKAKEEATARERLLGAAYELFAAQGVNRVGVEAILARSGCAKASLYCNFASKTDLALAFLRRCEEIWTRNWLETEILRRGADPEARLLAVFDVLDGWFHQTDFEGCALPGRSSTAGRAGKRRRHRRAAALRARLFSANRRRDHA
jgi:AcrR family transcriptional regulator